MNLNELWKDCQKKCFYDYMHIRLIMNGTLTPVKSYEEYCSLVQNARDHAGHRLFTNCYMLKDEIQRLISLKAFYQVNTENCLAFVDDEETYYYLFLYVDLEEKIKIQIPQLDRDILAEDVFYSEKKAEKQQLFEQLLLTSGFNYKNTYLSVIGHAQIAPEKYFKKMELMETGLASENKKIVVPSGCRQLKKFEKIYCSEIDRYVQKRYTRKERRQQARERLLHCVADKKGNVYAIHINGSLRGGAIAARKDCHANMYAPALIFYAHKSYYENMPQDPDKRAAYTKNQGMGGWIAVDNKSSWRLHKALGITASNKSMNQYILQAIPMK